MDDSSSTDDRFYDKYGKLVYKVANQLVHNHDDAIDIKNDVWSSYLYAVKKGKMFVSEKHRMNWLAKVAYFNAVKEYNRKLKHDCVEYEDFMSNIVQVYVSEDPRVDLIMEECEKLKPMYKIPFKLHYLEDYKISEISSMLVISENAVKKRLERSRKSIREAIEKRGKV